MKTAGKTAADFHAAARGLADGAPVRERATAGEHGIATSGTDFAGELARALAPATGEEQPHQVAAAHAQAPAAPERSEARDTRGEGAPLSTTVREVGAPLSTTVREVGVPLAARAPSRTSPQDVARDQPSGEPHRAPPGAVGAASTVVSDGAAHASELATAQTPSQVAPNSVAHEGALVNDGSEGVPIEAAPVPTQGEWLQPTAGARETTQTAPEPAAATSRSGDDADRAGAAAATSRSGDDADRAGAAAATSRSGDDADRAGAAGATSRSGDNADRAGAAAATSRSGDDADCAGSAGATSRSGDDADRAGAAGATSRSGDDANCAGAATGARRDGAYGYKRERTGRVCSRVPNERRAAARARVDGGRRAADRRRASVADAAGRGSRAGAAERAGARCARHGATELAAGVADVQNGRRSPRGERRGWPLGPRDAGGGAIGAPGRSRARARVCVCVRVRACVCVRARVCVRAAPASAPASASAPRPRCARCAPRRCARRHALSAFRADKRRADIECRQPRRGPRSTRFVRNPCTRSSSARCNRRRRVGHRVSSAPTWFRRKHGKLRLRDAFRCRRRPRSAVKSTRTRYQHRALSSTRLQCPAAPAIPYPQPSAPPTAARGPETFDRGRKLAGICARQRSPRSRRSVTGH